MIDRETQLKLIETEMAKFPPTFGLRAYPEFVFRVNHSDSYVRDNGEILLYTDVRHDGKWKSFAKGTPAELRKELITHSQG